MNREETKKMLEIKKERIEFWEKHSIIPNISSLKDLIKTKGMVKV